MGNMYTFCSKRLTGKGAYIYIYTIKALLHSNI